MRKKSLRNVVAIVESLEDRQLLSASVKPHVAKTVVTGFSAKQLQVRKKSYTLKDAVAGMGSKYILETKTPAPVFSHLTNDTLTSGLLGAPSSSSGSPSVPQGTPGQFHLNLIEGPNLQLPENAAAKAAFEAAAAYIETQFTDPITVNLDVDFAPIQDKNVLGETEVSFADFDPSAYDDIVARLKQDGTSNETVAGQLPDHFSDFLATIPASDSAGKFTLGGLQVPTANLMALGVPASDPTVSQSRVTSKYDPSQSVDGSIIFNSLDADEFSFDPTATVVPFNQADFEQVAIHEMTHALGFDSGVDDVDAALVDPTVPRVVLPTVQDLFRIAAGTGLNFATTPRAMATGFDIPTQVLHTGGDFDPSAFGLGTMLTGEIPMSTGAFTGDGEQASHWKDDVLSTFGNFGSNNPNANANFTIGIMDPTAASGFNVVGGNAPQRYSVNDLRAMDIIGYDLPAPVGGEYSFSQTPVTVSESAGGVSVTVNRSGGTSGIERINYTTVAIPKSTDPTAAVPGQDYTSTSGQLVFADGQSSATIFVPIFDNNVTDGDRSFQIQLSPNTTELLANAATDGTLSDTVTIQDDDSAFEFSAPNFYAKERDGQAVITVVRDGSILTAEDVNVTSTDGTATAGSDYVAVSNTLHFDVGEREKSFIVPIIKDGNSAEGTETVNLALSDATGGALVGTQSTATLNIQESSSPVITSLQTNSSNGKKIDSLTATFSEPLAIAPPMSSIFLYQRSGNGAFGSGNRKLLTISSTNYDASTGNFTIVPSKPLKNGTTYQLVIVPNGVTDPNGNALDGNGDGVPGDQYSAFITRSNKLSFKDRVGNQIKLTLNVGTMDMVQGSDGSIQTLRLMNTVAGTSQLRGVITPQSGTTTIQQILGSTGVDLQLPTPQFVVNSIS